MEIGVVLAVLALVVAVLAVGLSLAGHARQQGGRPRWSRAMVVLFAVLVATILVPVVYALVRVAAAFAELG
jgi:cytochrome c biogenesis factor